MQNQQHMAMGGPPGMQMPPHMMDHEMIGAIKIKDGLFIGDELASTVSFKTLRAICENWKPSVIPVRQHSI